jgi:uncharacterized protein (TIGR00369 family)
MSQSYAVQGLFGKNRPEFVEHVPHCEEIGIQCLEVGPCEATLMIPYREELVGDPTRGVVFGGVITTLLDQAGGVATLCSLPEITTIATVDLRIDYLRAAVPGRDLFGRAECIKRTKSVAFVRGKAWDDDPEDPFAICIGTFMLGANPTEHPLVDKLTKVAG